MTGPFFRYYINDYFLHVDVGFGSIKSLSDFGGSRFSTSYGQWGFNAGVGRAIFLSEFVSIEPMIKYTFNKVDFESYTESEGGLVIQIYLGFYIE